MDLHKLLLFLLATVVALGGRLRMFTEQFLHIKDLLLHYVWFFLHQFLPKRHFVLDRLPRHVAFSIADYGNDLFDSGPLVGLPDLAKLVFWCGRYGVEKVSVYDWYGVVAREANTKALSDLVWANVTSKEGGLENFRLMINGVCYDETDEKPKNGIAARTLDVVTLDWTSGRRAIVEASREFGSDVKAGRLDARSKTTNEFAIALNEYLNLKSGITAPDLLIEFGAANVGDSTCGYPPLALRVVEIAQIPRHRGVDELAFLECLEKYSQRDRRFGK